MKHTAMFALLLAPLTVLHAADVPAKNLNILWFVVDDMSANFSCYGEKTIQTPNVDRLAREGTLFTNAFITAPVCSPCRSALITGMYQTSIGAHHHRSGRGTLKIHLPQGVVPVPKLFQQAGYYTCIGGFGATGDRLGKTDYNFEWPRAMYDSNDWAGRKAGQPFFMQVQLHGGKYRGQGPNKNWQGRVAKELGANTRPEDVTLPPYYPRDPVILQDWADYLDSCRFTDNTGFRLVIGSWKIIAIWRPRTLRMSLSGRDSRSRPSKIACPPTTRPGGDATRRMIDIAVTLLPQPDSPTMPNVWPG